MEESLLAAHRESERLRDALEKEQENSYKLLQDIHVAHSDNQLTKD